MPCFHYQAGGSEAWIAVSSMLPVVTKDPTVEITYQFLDPDMDLALTPEEAAVLKKREDLENAYRALR
jgi:hypothetical protein